MNTNKQLLKALTELANRVQIMLDYQDRGDTVTYWTDKQSLAKAGTIANCDALREAQKNALKTIKDAQ